MWWLGFSRSITVLRNQRLLQCVSLLIKTEECTVVCFITLYNIPTLIWSCRVAHNKKTQTHLSVMKCLWRESDLGEKSVSCMSCTVCKAACEKS